MPPESGIPGSPSDWLGRAESDLALAKVPLPSGALYEDLCFHAQQAAEKAVKSVDRAGGYEFRYTTLLSCWTDSPGMEFLFLKQFKKRVT